MAISRKITQKSQRKVEQFTLNSVQASNKEVFLLEIPSNPDSVVLDIPSGTIQFNGFDFDVDGNRIYWDGFALQTVLELNDKIIIIYD